MAFRQVVLFLFALALSAGAFAADWPARPIHLVVPYPVGGGTDLTARLIGPKLSEALKQPVVVENKLGANGAIAVDAVAKSAPDGYTVLFDSMSFVITPILQKVPYDPVKDLQPVAKHISQAFAVVATPKLQAKSLPDIVRIAASRPNGLNAAVPGAATRLAAELFKLQTGANLTFIPYKGGGPATLAIMSGETDLGFMDVPSVAQNVLAGRMNAVAVTTERRDRLLPDVPTTAEAGMPQYRVDSWLGSFIPAGTPMDIVERYNREINAALAMPDVAAKIAQLGGVPAQSSVAEFTKLVRDEAARWKEVVVRANVKVE